jgi:hypothetical protein
MLGSLINDFRRNAWTHCFIVVTRHHPFLDNGATDLGLTKTLAEATSGDNLRLVLLDKQNFASALQLMHWDVSLIGMCMSPPLNFRTFGAI